jgi:hypothetical protein
MFRNSYTVAKKLIVLKIASIYGVLTASLKTRIPLSNIYRWFNSREKLLNIAVKPFTRNLLLMMKN